LTPPSHKIIGHLNSQKYGPIYLRITLPTLLTFYSKHSLMALDTHIHAIDAVIVQRQIQVAISSAIIVYFFISKRPVHIAILN
jgi:hypothetical protein